MNLRKTLMLCLMLLVAGTVSAQNTSKINKDSLPADAIIVKRVPLQSGATFDVKDVLVVDTIPSTSEGLSIVLYNDNTWRYVRNRNIDVLDETIYTQNWDTTKIHVYNWLVLYLMFSVAIVL